MKQLLILIIFVLFVSGIENRKRIEVYGEPVFEANEFQLEAIPVQNEFNMTDTIFVRYDQNGLLHSYYRRFQTEVCMTKECRPLDIFLYWNVTGRYLGYALPEGEFLSKTDHVKFKNADYQKLHQLLTDPFSGLKNYRLEELVPSDFKDSVDAVSSATIADVKQYIVEDAVYTTYIIWHLIYGENKQRIEDITVGKLSNELIIKILDSSDYLDVVWGLQHIPEDIVWNEDLLARVFQLAKSEQLVTADFAIKAIPSSILAEEIIQSKFLELFEDENTNFILKRKLLIRLHDAPILQPFVKKKLASSLPEYSGSLVNNVLDLFEAHEVNDEATEEIIAGLLKNENRFIARKAYQYLDEMETDNKKIERLLKKYENQ